MVESQNTLERKVGCNPLINNTKVHKLFGNLKIQNLYTLLLIKNISAICYVSNKRSDDTHVLSVFHNIISNLCELLLQPFNMTGYLLNLFCHLSYFIIEQNTIFDQHLILISFESHQCVRLI